MTDMEANADNIRAKTYQPVNKQTKAWESQFGVDYTKRNLIFPENLDAQYLDRYGVSRTDLNERFLDSLPKGSKILEVGTNTGIQLAMLKAIGFTELYGIDVSKYAINMASSITDYLNIIYGEAQDIPFKDGYFDLVFTSGVLIHIHPLVLPLVMAEMYRCTKKYIWGFEYYAEEYTEIAYHDCDITKELLWKADFPKLFCGVCPDLKLIKKELLKYKDNDNQDVMYLLGKL